MSKTMTLHVRYTFWYISFPSSAKQQREMTRFLSFFFWRTGTHEGDFFFSYWTWAPSLRIQFPDSSKAWRMKMNNISSKPEMAEVSACGDVLPRCQSQVFKSIALPSLAWLVEIHMRSRGLSKSLNLLMILLSLELMEVETVALVWPLTLCELSLTLFCPYM